LPIDRVHLSEMLFTRSYLIRCYAQVSKRAIARSKPQWCPLPQLQAPCQLLAQTYLTASRGSWHYMRVSSIYRALLLMSYNRPVFPRNRDDRSLCVLKRSLDCTSNTHRCNWDHVTRLDLSMGEYSESYVDLLVHYAQYHYSPRMRSMREESLLLIIHTLAIPLNHQ